MHGRGVLAVVLAFVASLVVALTAAPAGAQDGPIELTDPIEGDWRVGELGALRFSRTGEDTYRADSIEGSGVINSSCPGARAGEPVFERIAKTGDGAYTSPFNFVDGRCQLVGTDPAARVSVQTYGSMRICAISPSSGRSLCVSGSLIARARLKYTAVGDSYSSGEGAERAASDYSGGGCHRSRRAWPQLLDDATERLELTINLACSGALTSAFTRSFKGQAPQLAAIPAGAQVATVTIGGNDAGFSKVLSGCFLPPGVPIGTCVGGRSAFAAVAAKIDRLGRTLPGLYRRIAARVAYGRVIVVGYPRIFPRPASFAASPGQCRWLAAYELRSLDRMQQRLETTLARAAAAADLPYVSVYDSLSGHELCSADPWLRKIAFTLKGKVRQQLGHPTADGQRAIATAVASRISALFM